MSLIYSAHSGIPNLCGLLQTEIETKQAAARALQDANDGNPPADLAERLVAQGAAAKAMADAVAVADVHTPAGCTHALVIGVGEYPHLLGGSLFATQPAVIAMGLGQLTCSVKAAQAITDWLLTAFNNSTRPLASVELLLSPGRYTPSDGASDTLGITRGTNVIVETATSVNIKAAFDRWLVRCNHDRRAVLGSIIGDAAFFFFSGHGLEKEVSLLLPEDFGASVTRPFATAIDLTSTHRLMGQSKADLQCWFVDSCREAPIELLTSLEKPGIALKGDTGDPFLLRDAPIYQAAAEGRQAFGLPNQPTYFTEQLIACLNGLGADRKVAGRWRVTTQSLRTGLNASIERLPLINGKRVTCDSGSGKSNFTRDIHFAPDPVRVLATVFCDPFDVQPMADLYLLDASGRKIPRPARDANLWMVEVPAGTYQPGADFDPGGRAPCIGDPIHLIPPDNPLPISVS